MSDFRFVAEGVYPNLNHAYRIVTIGGRCPACGRGKTTLAKADGVESWQTMVALQARNARPRGWVPGRRVRITLCEYTKTERQDCDSPIKSALDAIAHGLGVDDHIFLVTVASKEVDKLRPRLEVSIENEDD